MTFPRAMSAAAMLAITIAPYTAQADEHETDGAYGRLDSPFSASLGAGIDLFDRSIYPSAQGSIHYLYTAGVFVSATPDLSNQHANTTATAGVSLHPLFLPRFFQNLEHGPALVDLAVDSLAIKLGTTIPLDELATGPGLLVGISAGIPLRASAHGLWLTGDVNARWPSATMKHASGGAPTLIGGLRLCYLFSL